MMLAMTEEDIPESAGEMTPEVRVNLALNLRGELEDWMAGDGGRQQAATPIWNDLQAADISEEDPDADAAFKRASRGMILNGILTSRELDDLIANTKKDFGD